MKIKKILITFSILVFFSLIVESICPKIVIYGAPNIKAKVQVVMDFYDKYYDGDVSLWYVDKLKNSTKEKKSISYLTTQLYMIKKEVRIL